MHERARPGGSDAGSPQGYKSINELIAFLRERIRCERVHCRNLTKLSRRAVGQGEFGTLASAIDRLRVDVVQGTRQRRLRCVYPSGARDAACAGANERLSYSSSLETDVLPELAEMKELYEKVNGKLIQEGRRVTKVTRRGCAVPRKAIPLR